MPGHATTCARDPLPHDGRDPNKTQPQPREGTEDTFIVYESTIYSPDTEAPDTETQDTETQDTESSGYRKLRIPQATGAQRPRYLTRLYITRRKVVEIY
jgi:hypothetical protein